jgi:small conductance mechanosensitive channel
MDWEKIWKDVNERAVDWIFEYGPKLIAAILIYIVGKWVAKFIRKLLKKIMIKAKTDETLASFLGNIVYALLMIVVIIAALGKLGVDTGSFVALIAAAGLAVGFALQGSLSNFAAGVMIILFRPFKLGDYIEAGGTAGSVSEIMIFSTVLKTPDNKKVIVPNSSMTDGNIINYSASDTRRVDMVFGTGYDDDLRKAKALLEEIVTGHELVLKSPAPQVVVSELADSSVNFNVRPWVKTADYWTVNFDIQEQVKLKFDEAGISIPFPQQDVHMHQVA